MIEPFPIKLGLDLKEREIGEVKDDGLYIHPQLYSGLAYDAKIDADSFMGYMLVYPSEIVRLLGCGFEDVQNGFEELGKRLEGKVHASILRRDPPFRRGHGASSPFRKV